MRISSYISLLAGLALTARAWEVVVYIDTENCDATSDSTYRIWDSDKFGECIEVGDAPPSDVSCAEYVNGGVSNHACGKAEGDFIGYSINTYTATDPYPERAVECIFYASKGCPENNFDQADLNQCSNVYAAQSFRCSLTCPTCH